MLQPNERCCSQRRCGTLCNCAGLRPAPFTANLFEPLQQNVALGDYDHPRRAKMSRPSRPSTFVLDAQSYPFTEAEVYAAFRQTESIRQAKYLARFVADGVRGQRQSQRAAQAAIARGSRDPMEINPAAFGIPDALPWLAISSDAMRHRVEARRAADRSAWRERDIASVTRELSSEELSADPSPDSMLDARYAAEDAEWRATLDSLRDRIARASAR